MAYKQKKLAVTEGGTGLSSTTANQILYSSATNTIGGLTSANSGVLSTSSSGVPSIDTTNFAVLSTGLQLKGNNTNTAPPVGFIGERISSYGTGVALTDSVVGNVTSISVTAGVWDISCLAVTTFSGSSLAIQVGINTVSATMPSSKGDNYSQFNVGLGVPADLSASVLVYRVLLSSTTTYYLVCGGFGSNSTANGRITAVRVA